MKRSNLTRVVFSPWIWKNFFFSSNILSILISYTNLCESYMKSSACLGWRGSFLKDTVICFSKVHYIAIHSFEQCTQHQFCNGFTPALETPLGGLGNRSGWYYVIMTSYLHLESLSTYINLLYGIYYKIHIHRVFYLCGMTIVHSSNGGYAKKDIAFLHPSLPAARPPFDEPYLDFIAWLLSCHGFEVVPLAFTSLWSHWMDTWSATILLDPK